MYVYVYVCIYICMYVYVYVCIYICMYVCVCVYTYVCMYMHIHVYVYVYLIYSAVHVKLTQHCKYSNKKFLKRQVRALTHFSQKCVETED